MQTSVDERVIASCCRRDEHGAGYLSQTLSLANSEEGSTVACAEVEIGPQWQWIGGMEMAS
jgi:hypothetical protein